MGKYIIRLSMLLIMLASFQIVVGQDIIMGTVPLVNDIEDQPRNFYDPGGRPGSLGPNQDPDGYFPQNCRDTITLRVTFSTCVMYALFEEFSMSIGDTLWIFDGPNCSSPLIGVYNLVNSPGEVYATGKNMTFVFHSDNQDVPGLQDGWVAKVYGYDTTQTAIIMGTDYFNVTCNAKFYDSGGPTGNIASNNENAFAEFSSPVGTHLKCVFTQFAVNGILKVYDGLNADPNKRLIGQFCTSTLDATTGNKPPVLFSSQSALTFVYVGASGDVGKAGWAAEISCVTELFESPDGSACPSINNLALGAYSEVSDPNIIDFDCSKPIVLLDAEVVATGPYSNDYTIKQIPFESRIFEFNEGTNIGANSDDSWQSGVSLPFKFSFFGKTYQMVYPGTNGLISMSPQSGYCSFSYSPPPASPPYSSIPYNYKNCIYGVNEDIDCRYFVDKNDGLGMGAVRVGVLGDAPCRAFVFNYLNVGLYNHHSTNNNYNTYQMVIYEGTNIIDVYIKHRDCCATTNSSGEGLVGLQNSTSSQILYAPGRGTTSWTADNEGWRFTPITPLDENSTMTWYVGSVSPANILTTGAYASARKITVSPQETTKYISEYTFTNAAGDVFVLRDTTLIRVSIPSITTTSNTGNSNICPNDPAHLTVTAGNEFPNIHPDKYQWSSGDTTATCVVTPSQTTTYYVTLTFDNGCTRNDSVKVLVTDLEFPTITGDDTICSGESSTLVATHPSSNEYHWSSGQSTSTITVSPQITTEYVVSATMTGNCIVTDSFTVVVIPLPRPAFIATPTDIFVENGIGTVTCNNLSPEEYFLTWDFGDPFSNTNIVHDVEDPSHDYTRSGYFTITLTAEDSLGCIDSAKTRVSVSVPYFFYVPNSFTPDGDGINETFAPKGEGVDPDNYLMEIFDRNGVLVFSTRSPFDYWDGRNKYGQMCPEGVYVYLIRLKDLNAEDKEYMGTVTLVR